MARSIRSETMISSFSFSFLKSSHNRDSSQFISNNCYCQFAFINERMLLNRLNFLLSFSYFLFFCKKSRWNWIKFLNSWHIFSFFRYIFLCFFSIINDHGMNRNIEEENCCNHWLFVWLINIYSFYYFLFVYLLFSTQKVSSSPAGLGINS